MSKRITQKDLDKLCDRINELTNSPMEYDRFNPNTGKIEACIGHYFVSSAYGGWQLQRLHNSEGGVTLPLGYGYVPARRMYERLQDFINVLYTRDTP